MFQSPNTSTNKIASHTHKSKRRELKSSLCEENPHHNPHQRLADLEIMKAPDQSKKRVEGRTTEVAGGGLLLLGGALVAAVLGTAALRTRVAKRRRPITGEEDGGGEGEGEEERAENRSIGSTGNGVGREIEEGLRSLLQFPPAPLSSSAPSADHDRREEEEIPVNTPLIPVDTGDLKIQLENLSEINGTTNCGNSSLITVSEADDNHQPSEAMDHVLTAPIDKDIIVDESKATQFEKFVEEVHPSTGGGVEEEDDVEEVTEEESTEETVTEEESGGSEDSSMESNAEAVWPTETIETPSMDKLKIQSEVTRGEKTNELKIQPKVFPGEMRGREDPEIIPKTCHSEWLLFFFFLASTLVAALMVHWLGRNLLNIFEP